MVINDNIINDIFWDKNNKFTTHSKTKLTDDIKQYLYSRFSDFNSFKETIYRIKHNIINIPKCIYCGKNAKFINCSIGYIKICGSKKCSSKHRSDILFKNTGYHNVSQNPKVKEKIKETFIKKYGVSNPNKTKIVRDKIKQTCINKYGVPHHWLNEKIKEKRRQTWINKYGVDVCSQAEVVKQKMSNTCKEKYGVNWFTQTAKLIQCANTEQTKEKQFKTKIKNQRFSKSKEEDKVFEILNKHFKSVIRQHSDKILYPYHCDFYIKDIDTWIEYNGSEFHHYHPFNEFSEEDIIELNLLKEKSKNRKQKTGKNKSLYDSIIYTWTILDPKKRNIAKINNLKYFEFWNVSEVIKWLEQY